LTRTQPKKDESIEDQPAEAELEQKTKELGPEDVEKIAGGARKWGGRQFQADLVPNPVARRKER
jgi:hypothetical protein